ncbi:MAG: cobalamin-binding protein [Armatimonadota bacterium]|nr:cobalamin-binding protein [Armatimonadota bacterium]MDW8025153.1 cobalamin-binding protein [Armatimonadota bacterium]
MSSREQSTPMRIVKVLMALTFWLHTVKAQQLQQVVKDDLGRFIKLNRSPKRIISLSPSTTELLFAIGAGRSVVAVDDWSDYPPEVRRLPRVGPFMRPNIEAVVKHNPDLIVLASVVLPISEVEALEGKVRAPIFVMSPKRVIDITSAVERIGKLVGKYREAKSLANRMRSEIRRIKASQSKLKRKPSVFIEVSPPPSLMGVGINNFIDDAIGLAGGYNILRQLKPRSEFPTVSLEALMTLNPDVYILARHGRLNSAKAFSEVKGRVGFEQLKAVRTGRVYAIDADLIFRPGPRITLGIAELHRLLHGHK